MRSACMCLAGATALTNQISVLRALLSGQRGAILQWCHFTGAITSRARPLVDRIAVLIYDQFTYVMSAPGLPTVMIVREFDPQFIAFIGQTLPARIVSLQTSSRTNAASQTAQGLRRSLGCTFISETLAVVVG